MQRVLFVLLVVAVAILACRDRQREQRLAQLEQEVRGHINFIEGKPSSATDTVAKTLTGATLGQFISDPLKRQITSDVVDHEFDEAHRMSLEALCTRLRMLGRFPAYCEVVGVAPQPIKAPLGRGRACDAKSKCDPGLQCVDRGGLAKATCELVCSANAKCPEDERCVLDGNAHVCRPINDATGL